MTQAPRVILELRATPEGPLCAYMCSRCRIIYGLGLDGLKAAEQCCAPRRCEDCDAITDPGICICRSCLKKRFDLAFVRRLNAARHVLAQDWTGPVHEHGEDDEGWHESVAASSEEGLPSERPSWLWGCSEERLSLNANAILELAMDDADCSDGAREDAFDGVDDLQHLLDVWAKAHAVTWWKEIEVVVIVDEERFRKEFPEVTLKLAPPVDLGQNLAEQLLSKS